MTRRGASQEAKAKAKEQQQQQQQPSGIANAIKGAIANKEPLKTVGLPPRLTD